MTYPVSPLTTPSRYPERATYDKAGAHELLDSQYVCHVAFAVDGVPKVLPTLFVRVGDKIFLHGSTGATAWLAARGEGLPAVVAVTSVDALVLARSQFHHSANYRSLIAHGTARLVTDEPTKHAAMTALVDKVGFALAGLPSGADVPDELRRSTHTRPPTTREYAATAVLEMDLVDVSVKRRSGGVGDDEPDLALPYWAGVVPLATTAGPARADRGVTAATPSYVSSRAGWWDPARLVGSHVTLEALAPEHADDIWRLLSDPSVTEFLTFGPMTRPEQAAAYIEAARGNPDRVPWAIRDNAGGEIIGTTSYYNVKPAFETVAIGHTKIARSHWRTAVNTEAKLLLLTRTFEVLGAGRVEWHTDLRNERSQAAIARLGAAREGVIRRQKRRADGSWRDTVQFAMLADEWPTARKALVARLAEGHTGAHAGHR